MQIDCRGRTGLNTCANLIEAYVTARVETRFLILRGFVNYTLYTCVSQNLPCGGTRKRETKYTTFGLMFFFVKIQKTA